MNTDTSAPLDPRGRQSIEIRRELVSSLVSVAGMVGRPVRHADGSLIGRLADFVVLAGPRHPPVTGYVVEIAKRRVWPHAGDVAGLDQSQLFLQKARFDFADVQRRPGEIQPFGDVVDHQLVDIRGERPGRRPGRAGRRAAQRDGARYGARASARSGRSSWRTSAPPAPSSRASTPGPKSSACRGRSSVYFVVIAAIIVCISAMFALQFLH